MTLALCMIVKNEEATLGRCLKSAEGVFDEIVIADTGSADGTKAVAAQFTENIYDFPWEDDFAAARNFSFSKAQADYLMWLDADDVLKEEDRAALLALKARLDGSIDAYYLRYDAAEDEYGRPALQFYRERIVRRACNFTWQGAVHEALCVGGNVRREEIAVTHRRGKNKERGRNLRIFLRGLLAGNTPCGRSAYYFARELFDNGLDSVAANVFTAFLRGEGCAEDKIGACLALAEIFRRQNKPRLRHSALLHSFCYGAPRPAACCALGELFLEQGDPATAVFWFKLAVNEGKNSEKQGFFCPDLCGYRPCIWLCVCYDRLGDHRRAALWNERAGAFKPNDASYLYNRAYFARLNGTHLRPCPNAEQKEERTFPCPNAERKRESAFPDANTELKTECASPCSTNAKQKAE